MAMQPLPLKAFLDELGDGQARNEHAVVDTKAQPREPGMTGEVRRRDAFADASREQAQHLLLLLAGQARRKQHVRRVRVEAERVQYERRGFVEGVVRALTVTELGLGESARAPSNEVPDAG